MCEYLLNLSPTIEKVAWKIFSVEIYFGIIDAPIPNCAIVKNVKNRGRNLQQTSTPPSLNKAQKNENSEKILQNKNKGALQKLFNKKKN